MDSRLACLSAPQAINVTGDATILLPKRKKKKEKKKKTTEEAG